MLDRLSLVDETRNRRYLLEKTQHIIGGFGKCAGEPPGQCRNLVELGYVLKLLDLDLLHAYFGMVSLAFQGEPGLKRVDPSLGASESAARHLESLPWWQP